MHKLTERELFIIVVGVTAAMLIMCLTVIGLVMFYSRKRREWDEELQVLRDKKKRIL